MIKAITMARMTATRAAPDELLLLDEAIEKLAAEDAVAAELVKIRYFAGMSVEQAATALGISRATAYRQWTYVRAWLHCEIQPETGAK